VGSAELNLARNVEGSNGLPLANDWAHVRKLGWDRMDRRRL